MNLEIVSRPKTRDMQLVEIERGIDLATFLREEYGAGRKLAEIAADLQRDTGTISRWMAHFGIPTRRRAA